MQCSNCGTQNDAAYKFCMKCGSPLVAQSQEPHVQTETSPAPAVSHPVSSPPPPPEPLVRTPPPASQPVYSPPPSPPTNYTSSSPSYPPTNLYTSPNLAFGSQGLSFLNLWGPFAGYGTRRRHIGWLMDNRGDQAQNLIQKVNGKFGERQIPGAVLRHETLTARGVAVENRPYFILKRGLASLGLYIAQFGRDMFISLVSYLKPPISNFRAVVLALMVLFWGYTTFVFPVAVSEAANQAIGNVSLFGGSSGDPAALIGLLCIVGPLGALNSFLLFLFLLYSLYKWLMEKDFWAGLRVTPNEFNEDDLMAMEKAVEQTVRIALDEIGLDPTELKPIEGTSGRRLI